MANVMAPPGRDAALAFLYSRIDYERALAVPYSASAYRLDRMRDLLRRLGNPERDLPIVHVAGTKGKGSTSAMIAAMLSATGRRTGLFTSPHLDRLEERMMIDAQPCAAAELVGLVDELRPVVEQMDAEAAAAHLSQAGPTYFELTTAMSLLHFARQRVDAAVLEVGMGGRLDSTNVCQPLVSVITSISFDHTRQLGGTLAAIAREKAGIVKPRIPVVSGVTADEPRQEIEAACRRNDSPLVQLGRDFEFDYRAPAAVEETGRLPEFDFRAGESRQFRHLRLGLLGRHQGANAAVALATLVELERQGWHLPESAMRRGLAELRWPARIELVARRPAVVIDAAHNVASVAALVDTLAESFVARPRTLIFATTREKDCRGMLRLLLPRFDCVVLTRYLNNPRFVPPEELLALTRELAPRGTAPAICPHPASAWAEASRNIDPNGLICVTGSFFIASEIRAEIDRASSAAYDCPLPVDRAAQTP
jgi:dihydrofolate synthase / folylpolyglutamate synthase